MIDHIRILKLAIKYWLQGDSWDFAVEFATKLVKGFKHK
jgi:hypothetical protein